MKKAGKEFVISGLLILALLASGCSAADYKSESTTMEAAAYDTGEIYSLDSEESYSEEMVENKSTEPVEVKSSQRKLITTVNMDVETESFDELLKNLEKKTETFGGYIEASNIYNGSNYYGAAQRNAGMTIRIPAASLKEFLSCVAEESNVISQNESVEDVTLAYVDMDSHKKALQAEQKSLLELMEKAETIEDIIALESRLSEVRYQIESMESQLRSMDNQVSYSTVNLQINEVIQYTPAEDRSRGEKIADGFVNSLKNIWNGTLDFFVGLIIASPYLILCAVIVILIIWIIKLLIKHENKKQQKKQQKQNPGLQKSEAETGKESKGTQN